ncbi:MAG TPA: iron-sulfur cluster repair di-iron protein [Blastocatellia bacterium]|nr:iron-sulfur cluster repair di-iron protein [Blastocatellia bacterium]
MTISAMKTVGEMAVEIPEATRVFEKMGIDYCCGGGKSLEEASFKAGVSIEAITQALEEAAQSRTGDGEFKDWQAAALFELTAYIVKKHHVFTRDELDRLEPLMDKVCSAHGRNHSELLRVGELFQGLKQELITHMQKEEKVLFPYVEQMEQAAGNHGHVAMPFFGTVRNPVRMMMVEHDAAGEILDTIRKITSDYRVPEEACISYRTLYQALEAFERDLHQHIHLENNILFPRAIEIEAALRQRDDAIV